MDATQTDQGKGPALAGLQRSEIGFSAAALSREIYWIPAQVVLYDE
jgi:hypothetical protein